jgi:hypothetical protein
LGYDKIVEHSLEWSAQRALGVALALDGQIYERATGTHLTQMGCNNEIDE